MNAREMLKEVRPEIFTDIIHTIRDFDKIVARRRKAAEAGRAEDKVANVNAAVKMSSGRTLDER